MKHLFSFQILTVIILIICFLPAVCAVADATDDTPQSLVITQPSDNETNFGEKRDFYVYGVFPDRLEYPGDIRIEVMKGDNADGERVRLLESHVDPSSGTTPMSSIETNYSEGLDWGNKMVADLVKEPGGLYDPSNKLVVTNDYYLGMILGGVTKDFDTTYRDNNGDPLEDLTAGNYTIKVTGLSGNLSGQTVEKNITFGLTDSLFGTDRPPVNLQNRISYAGIHHLRIDRDWFPGYFLFPGYNNTGYSIPKRWNPNNAIESINDQNGTVIDTPVVANNSLILYNINEKSTTYGVELSTILKYGLEDNRNTTFLLYDIGEPYLTYIDSGTGTRVNVTGTLTSFQEGNRMAFTRAEMYQSDFPEHENTFDPWNNTTLMQVDYNLSDGITVPSGDVFMLYGVTKPIQSSVNETNIPHRYTINNRIAHVTYLIRDEDGNDVYNSTRSVNLSRLFNQGSSDRFNSIFEFGHEFRMTDKPGRYTIISQGIDLAGKPVEGAENTITVTVQRTDKI
ncbi:hypothetical protein [Methanospirillum lacunae]|uniref:Uncharacterized protein n=1 Tax=Methanospirillum lacunae TaxID=668570 RepID=A0A2V2MQ77_9EURY|nr:hypothetical protein [Methanospirillum lacunae]PWR70384.1 hypothetical protein DK846_15000 [Methanospirillum lacunae]